MYIPEATFTLSKSHSMVLSNLMFCLTAQATIRNYHVSAPLAVYPFILLKQNNTAEVIDQGIAALVDSYGQRFREVLPYPSDFPAADEKRMEEFSKAVTSNLVGGVGYFYGTSIVDKKFSYEWDEEEDAQVEEGEKGARLTEPKALLTATPSRSFFPRGFYWDEGFHLLHIGQWDNDFR